MRTEIGKIDNRTGAVEVIASGGSLLYTMNWLNGTAQSLLTQIPVAILEGLPAPTMAMVLGNINTTNIWLTAYQTYRNFTTGMWVGCSVPGYDIKDTGLLSVNSLSPIAGSGKNGLYYPALSGATLRLFLDAFYTTPGLNPYPIQMRFRMHGSITTGPMTTNMSTTEDQYFVPYVER